MGDAVVSTARMMTGKITTKNANGGGILPTPGYEALIRAAILNPTALNVKGNLSGARKSAMQPARRRTRHASRDRCTNFCPRPRNNLRRGYHPAHNTPLLRVVCGRRSNAPTRPRDTLLPPHYYLSANINIPSPPYFSARLPDGKLTFVHSVACVDG